MRHIISFYGRSANFYCCCCCYYFFFYFLFVSFWVFLHIRNETRCLSGRHVVLIQMYCIVQLAATLCHSLLSVIICFRFPFHFFISSFLLHSSSLSFVWCVLLWFCVRDGMIFFSRMLFKHFRISHIRSDNNRRLPLPQTFRCYCFAFPLFFSLLIF